MSTAQIIDFTRPATAQQKALPDTAQALRLRRGLTQKDVAEMLNKPNSWVSKIEKGQTSLTGKDLTHYATVLRVKPQLLCEIINPVHEEAVYFRKYSIPEKIIKLIKAEAALRAKIITELAQAAGYSLTPKFIEFDTSKTDQSPIDIARIYRKRWGITNGPIVDIAGHIENEGVHLSPLPQGIGKVAGFSTRNIDGSCASTMFNAGLHGDTQRFTLAHEFGHLVMDRLSPKLDTKAIEARADAFAGELLAPYMYFKNDIQQLRTGDIASLLKLSKRWGLHPKSFIVRAKKEGDISETQSTSWYKAMGRTNKILIDATPTPYPVRTNRIGYYINELKEHKWIVPDLEERTLLFTDELIEIATPQKWPYKLVSDFGTSETPLRLVK